MAKKSKKDPSSNDETADQSDGFPFPSPYRIDAQSPLVLAELDPDDTGDYDSRKDAEKELEKQRKRIQKLQERLYAENKQSLLVVLQAMDTGGKDGTIRSIFEGVNPQGCVVASFKAPSSTELEHDFLWRIHAQTPARGMITVFNRSHYEDVLIVRVKNFVPEAVWRQRYEQINQFEHMLTLNNTRVIKFYLHISKAEQKERLQARLDDPEKRWKFAVDDLKERAYWDDYQAAFEDALNQCSTAYAPWYAVPANHKWYRNVVIARIIADTLEAMNPQFPESEDSLDSIEIPD